MTDVDRVLRIASERLPAAGAECLLIGSFPKNTPLPPRLSMNAYADLLSQNLRTLPRDRIDRQKEIEEQITARFSLSTHDGESPSEQTAT